MSPRRGVAGLTLIEMLVVLVLLGLALGLVAPSLLSPRHEAEENAVQRIIDAARRTAVRRAEAVTLAFQLDGRWVLEGGSTTDTLRLLAGSVAWPHAFAARLHISPLGACMLDAATDSEHSLIVDPVRCRLRGQ